MKNACQSCGMPLSKDPQGGGSEKDGTKSQFYCSHCYKNGAFTNPNISYEEMKEKVNEKMKEMRVPGFMRWFFTRNLAKLKRWNKSKGCGCK